VAEGTAELAARCDILVLAVPLPALPDVLDELAGAAVRPMLTDVTSVKGPVLELAAERDLSIIAGHPMAGTAESGFAASSADLLAVASWVLCVEDDTDLRDWLTVARLVIALGAQVVPTTAARHDAAVARISHLPHLLASALAQQASDGLTQRLAAGSFSDGTRVAATREELTAAMCSANAPAVVAALDETLQLLAHARQLLVDDADLRPWFAAGRLSRAQLTAPRPHLRRRVPTAGLSPAELRTLLRQIGDVGTITAIAPDGELTC